MNKLLTNCSSHKIFTVEFCTALCFFKKSFSKIIFFVFLLLLTFVFSNSVVASETLCFDNGGTGWAIADHDGVNPVTTTIINNFQFADTSIPIADIDVYLDVSHTYVGDLDASITSPTATGVQLFDRPGFPASAFGCGGNDIDVTFDDAAAVGTNIENVCNGGAPTISGTYQTQDNAGNPLSDVSSEQPDGNWQLDITDNANIDTGTLNQICLTYRGTLEFDKWVSTNATCSDQVDLVNVVSGTVVYYCYTVTNNGSVAFTVDSAVDDKGIDISGLLGTYNSSDSVTVNSPATLLPVGTTVNTATVTAGVMSTVETATAVVQTTAPAAGNKTLYLYSNPGQDLSRTVPMAAQANVIVDKGNPPEVWTLTPSLQKPLVITSGTIPVTLWVSKGGNGGGSVTRTLRITLDSTGTTSGQIGTLDTPNFLAPRRNTPTVYTFNVNVTGISTLATGSQITLTLENISAGGGRRRIRVFPVDPNGGGNSTLTFDTSTVINVQSVQYYDAVYPGGNLLYGGIPAMTFYVQAVVTDPFGSADITAATLDLIDNNATTVVTAAAMTEVFDSGADYKIYEYGPYTLPGFGSNGTWRAEVTTDEGSEGTVTHMGYGELVVGSPTLTTVKSASGATANPGDDITYNIQVNNTGNGVAITVVMDDNISPFTQFKMNTYGLGQPFQFTDGGTPSGLTLGTPVYSNDNGATYTYTPVSGGGGAPAGYDGNVTNWQIPMTGGMNASGSFTLQYQMRVE